MSDGKTLKISSTKSETTKYRAGEYHSDASYQVTVVYDGITYDFSMFTRDSGDLHFYLGSKPLDLEYQRVLATTLRTQVGH